MPQLMPVPVMIIYGIAAALMTALVAARRHGAAIVVPLPGMCLGFLAMSPSSFILALALVVVALVGAVAQLKWKAYVLSLLALFIGATILHHYDAQPRLAELASLRQQFPVQSLKTRLAFHERHPTPGGVHAAAVYRQTQPQHSSRSREWQLKRLHEASYEQFVAASGFGPIRMRRIDRDSIELPPIIRIPVVDTEICFDNREFADRARPQTPALIEIHRSGFSQFTDADRMGAVESIDRVIGFEPHAVASRPTPIVVAAETWHVARLELVSLLSHDEPVAYVSDKLPSLDDLDRLPTRPLDRFEQSRLPRLSDGEELLSDDEPTMIRMLGAIRASETCLACHSVPQRTLLGAFSYELRPVLVHESGTTVGK